MMRRVRCLDVKRPMVILTVKSNIDHSFTMPIFVTLWIFSFLEIARSCYAVATFSDKSSGPYKEGQMGARVEGR